MPPPYGEEHAYQKGWRQGLTCRLCDPPIVSLHLDILGVAGLLCLSNLGVGQIVPAQCQGANLRR